MCIEKFITGLLVKLFCVDTDMNISTQAQNLRLTDL